MAVMAETADGDLATAGRFNGAMTFLPWKFADSLPEGDEPIPLQWDLWQDH
jgi:hypothetical protein